VFLSTAAFTSMRHRTLLRPYVWRWITPPSQVWIDIDTTRAVNATSHSRWPCFSSGRCTGLEIGMHCLRRSEHRRRTWHFVASWKHCHSRHPLKTGHDCAIFLLHSVNCKFWHNVLYSAPAAFFCDSVTIILKFIIIIIIIIQRHRRVINTANWQVRA